MKRALLSLLAPLLLSVVATRAHAQYNAAAAQSAPMESVTETYKDDQGRQKTRTVQKRAQGDRYGNAQGNKYDLAVDGAFKGQTVAVLHFYTGEGFDFSLPKSALAEKGFSVYRWMNSPPPPQELKAALKKSCQLWIIAAADRRLTDEHVKIIKEFFDSGRGVYIWGDNEPYYADANVVGRALLGAEMLGNVMGDQTVGLQQKSRGPGIIPDHLLSTGLEHIYEGITIATVQPNKQLEPLIYGSAGNLVAAYYDQGGRRAIFDGGFTRLFLKWDTAGTARYVKNAAAWLVNVERFGKQVVAADLRAQKPAQ